MNFEYLFFPITTPVAIVLQKRQQRLCLIARGVEEQTHGDTTDEASNGDGHDPGEEQETHTLPVDSLEGTVAQTDTDGGTGDAHRGGHWQLVLGEDEDGDGGAHLHGRTAGRGVVGDLVAHDCCEKDC